jgi:hypothetical protein
MQKHEHNQNHVISVQATNDKDCAFDRVLQNMQDNKIVVPAEHVES